MRRHTFDPISFIFGALFAAIGLTFLFGDADIGDIHIAVVWPLPLIVVGLLMLVTTIQRRTRDHQPAPASVAAGVVPDDRPQSFDSSATGEARTEDLPDTGADLEPFHDEERFD